LQGDFFSCHCKGMAGLVEEGQELIIQSKEKDDIAADLGLIAAAQKVEHYEISGYLSARARASQAGENEVARLLGQSLLEEERTDKLLNRLATLLMEEAGELGGDDLEKDEREMSEVAVANGAETAVHDGNGRKTPKGSSTKSSTGKRR